MRLSDHGDRAQAVDERECPRLPTRRLAPNQRLSLEPGGASQPDGVHVRRDNPWAGEANYPSDGGGGLTGWETSERVLESGGFVSRQRVLVAEPVVEASEAGARTLGVAYWQAVDRFTRGGVRASWRGGGGN